MKAGFKERQLKDMSCEDVLQALTEAWLKEEAESAVGGTAEKAIENPFGPVSMEMLMQDQNVKVRIEREREEK